MSDDIAVTAWRFDLYCPMSDGDGMRVEKEADCQTAAFSRLAHKDGENAEITDPAIDTEKIYDSSRFPKRPRIIYRAIGELEDELE